MTILPILRCISATPRICTSVSAGPHKSLLLPSVIVVPHCISRGIRKHWNPKFKKERAAKVLKITLPDFDEERRESKMTIEEIRSKLKEKGICPIRPWNEKPMMVSCTGDIMDPYKPPESDNYFSEIKGGATSSVKDIFAKRGKSYMAVRKIRNYDYHFDVPTVAEKAKEIYIEANKALAEGDEDKLHDLVTEKAYPEMMENVKYKTINWRFIQSLETPRVTQVRCIEFGQKNNFYAQLTVRLLTQQMLAVYDRFGRLIHGSETMVKDVLEYVTFEKHITSDLGSWRIHGKVIPDWLPPRDNIKKTFMMPDIDTEYPEPPEKKLKPISSEEEHGKGEAQVVT